MLKPRLKTIQDVTIVTRPTRTVVAMIMAESFEYDSLHPYLTRSLVEVTRQRNPQDILPSRKGYRLER